MNERQELFVREYRLDHNGTQAAIRAGYAAGSANVTAARLLTNANVVRMLDEGRARQARRAAVTVDWVIEQLVTVYTRAMAATPVLNAKGEETGEWRYEGAVANKSLELLGKHIGMWPQKPIEINAQFDVTVRQNVMELRGLPREDLLRIVREKAPLLLKPVIEEIEDE